MTPDPDSLCVVDPDSKNCYHEEKINVYWKIICSTVQQKQGVYKQNSLRAGSQRKQQRDGFTQVNSSV